jgi:hypothetical protein
MTPIKADVIVVIEASLSMQMDLATWVPRHLSTLPQQLIDAGLDPRVALVRFATNQSQARPQWGPLSPDLLLDFTSSQAAWDAAFGDLLGSKRRRTEAGSKAIKLGLEGLTFREDAFRNVFVYTDEDDDAPASLGRGRVNREPPMRGPRSRGRFLTKWLAFQGRTDQTAQALIANHAMLYMVVNPPDRPTRSQYGNPAATRLLPGGGLDLAGTLAVLEGRGQEQSLQGQLLSSGDCAGNGLCTAGRVGSPCVVDIDCSLPARAYRIPRNNAEADALFPGLIADIVGEQVCPTPWGRRINRGSETAGRAPISPRAACRRRPGTRRESRRA